MIHIKNVALLLVATVLAACAVDASSADDPDLASEEQGIAVVACEATTESGTYEKKRCPSVQVSTGRKLEVVCKDDGTVLCHNIRECEEQYSSPCPQAEANCGPNRSYSTFWTHVVGRAPWVSPTVAWARCMAGGGRLDCNYYYGDETDYLKCDLYPLARYRSCPGGDCP